jgi:hypothetical protein
MERKGRTLKPRMVPNPPCYPTEEEMKNVTIRKRRSYAEAKTPARPRQENEFTTLFELLNSSFFLLTDISDLEAAKRGLDPDKKEPNLEDCLTVAHALSQVVIEQKLSEEMKE